MIGKECLNQYHEEGLYSVTEHILFCGSDYARTVWCYARQKHDFIDWMGILKLIFNKYHREILIFWFYFCLFGWQFCVLKWCSEWCFEVVFWVTFMLTCICKALYISAFILCVSSYRYCYAPCLSRSKIVCNFNTFFLTPKFLIVYFMHTIPVVKYCRKQHLESLILYCVKSMMFPLWKF